METQTPLPTEKSTTTATFTPTLVYSTETEFSEVRGARFDRTMSAGEFTISVLLIVLIFTLWGQFMYRWLRGWKAERR